MGWRRGGSVHHVCDTVAAYAFEEFLEDELLGNDHGNLCVRKVSRSWQKWLIRVLTPAQTMYCN
jgi:hypothetical protein